MFIVISEKLLDIFTCVKRLSFFEDGISKHQVY